MNRRRHSRIKGVLPVRVCGKDSSGSLFQELAHTLDLTPTSARLGAIRRFLSPETQLTIQYRQRKIEFRVVWSKLLQGTQEYHVGLAALGSEQDAWGLQASDYDFLPRPSSRIAMAGLA